MGACVYTKGVESLLQEVIDWALVFSTAAPGSSSSPVSSQMQLRKQCCGLPCLFAFDFIVYATCVFTRFRSLATWLNASSRLQVLPGWNPSHHIDPQESCSAALPEGVPKTQLLIWPELDNSGGPQLCLWRTYSCLLWWSGTALLPVFACITLNLASCVSAFFQLGNFVCKTLMPIHNSPGCCMAYTESI